MVKWSVLVGCALPRTEANEHAAWVIRSVILLPNTAANKRSKYRSAPLLQSVGILNNIIISQDIVCLRIAVMFNFRVSEVLAIF